ncbi:MAG: hypothetical protein PVI07_15860 [Anaerolineae bacterium]|jgi:hypothetical protein
MTGSRNWFVWRAVATVALLGLLVGGGFAIHRLGWSQGYAAAELTAQGEEAPAPPLAPPGWRPVGFARGGLLVSLLLGLLFFAFVGKLLRVTMWGAMAGPAMCHPAMGRSWRHPRHWMHGPMPPWYGPWYEQPGERSRESDSRENAEA